MKSARLMFLYAGFLFVCGFAAFALSGFAAAAKTAIIVGAGTAVVMIVCGLMSRSIHANKAVGMIGIHAGLILPLIFAALFAWRTMSAWQAYQQATRPIHLPAVLAIMTIGSIVVFVLLLMTRPKPAQRRVGNS